MAASKTKKYDDIVYIPSLLMYKRDRVNSFEHIFLRPRLAKNVPVRAASVVPHWCSETHTDKFLKNLGPRKICWMFWGEVSLLNLLLNEKNIERVAQSHLLLSINIDSATSWKFLTSDSVRKVHFSVYIYIFERFSGKKKKNFDTT